MSHDAAPIDALEPSQLAAAKVHPLPRRKLGRGTVALLVVLRIYIVVVIPIVGYAFFHALLASKS